MSHLQDGVFVVHPQEPAECDLCHKIRELRPYGPNGENVCLECGMKDEPAMKRQMAKRIGTASVVGVTPEAARILNRNRRNN